MCNLYSGQTTRRFVGHTKDVLSVAFSADNRQIVSGSRDKTIKLWNTLGVCKYTIQVHIFNDLFVCYFRENEVYFLNSYQFVVIKIFHMVRYNCLQDKLTYFCSQYYGIIFL